MYIRYKTNKKIKTELSHPYQCYINPIPTKQGMFHDSTHHGPEILFCQSGKVLLSLYLLNK